MISLYGIVLDSPISKLLLFFVYDVSDPHCLVVLIFRLEQLSLPKMEDSFFLIVVEPFHKLVDCRLLPVDSELKEFQQHHHNELSLLVTNVLLVVLDGLFLLSLNFDLLLKSKEVLIFVDTCFVYLEPLYQGIEVVHTLAEYKAVVRGQSAEQVPKLL